MSQPELGDTVYIVAKVTHLHAGARPYVRVMTKPDEAGTDSFLIYTDQITLIESKDENAEA